jgi:hypothetical protein
MNRYWPGELFTRKDVVNNNDSIAFGCSHTWGVGVEEKETWSYILGARNFGQGACSVDFISRLAPAIITEFKPRVVYVLWSEWRRFEITRNDIIYQSLPTDSDRIYYIETHNDIWCRENFKNKTSEFRLMCNEKNIQLVDITLYNLIPYIDHADRWPVSKLGHHYAPEWHQWVANVFKELQLNNATVELAYE